MADGRLFGAGGHSERPQETVDEDGELMDVLRLGLDHVKDDLVSLPHALGVRRADIVLHDGLPLPPAEPTAHEALHLRTNTGEDAHALQLCTRSFHISRQTTRDKYLFDFLDVGIFLLLVGLIE